MDVKDIKLLDDHVIVKQDSGRALTRSGIIIPATARIKPSSGTIITISDQDVAMNCSDLKVGDRVLFTWHKTHLFIHEGVEYILVSYPQLIAIIEGDAFANVLDKRVARSVY